MAAQQLSGAGRRALSEHCALQDRRARYAALQPSVSGRGEGSAAAAPPGHALLSRGRGGPPRGGACPQAVPATTLEPALESFPRGSHWEVHKFGGTCLATAERIRDAAKLIVEGSAPSTLVVVSAMGSHPTSPLKVTDLLLNMVARAARRDQAFLIDLAAIQEKHVETAKQLLGKGHALNTFVSGLLDDVANLKAMLQAIAIAGVVTDAFGDYVVGHGELWSARLFTATVRQLLGTVEGPKGCAFMDTREVVTVAPTADENTVDVLYEESDAALDVWAAQHGAPRVVVATGFVAKTADGRVTTLKRNGSDYSATILGCLSRAGAITIWTDVDGVFSADPRKVTEAVCLKGLSYHEAWEMSYFGASVLHPRTTVPAMRENIPIAIKNFFNPAAAGTVISDERRDLGISGPTTVKGFATIDHVSLINVEGTGMVGVPGTASDIFSTIRDASANVIMISQASSEHSVCFAVKDAEGPRAVQALQKRFGEAMAAGRISKIELIADCCVLAAVGQQMCKRKGVAATLFSALAKANINIRAVAQGSSEYNITVLVDQRDSAKALRAVHGRFYLAQLPLAVGIVGPGLIGRTLLAQLHAQAKELRDDFDIDVRVLAIANSRQMLLSEAAIDLAHWQETFDREAQPADLGAMAAHLAGHYVPNSVIIDLTASETPPAHYLEWMQAGCHIITPNKKLNSGPLDQYQALRSFQRHSYIHFLYEATVGAGLPVIATLKHLVDTGDRILRVEGVFSGTLSYIFNSLAPGTPFSAIVAQAKELGYTEPDPRDDLAGMDVARKVTILASKRFSTPAGDERAIFVISAQIWETGLLLELGQVAVESLVPEPLRGASAVGDFMAALPRHDADMAARLEAAQAAGECLRYVGVVDCQAGAGSVELRRYPLAHPFAQLQGSDNIIAFTTQRYSQQPLIVRGPGAGAEVTAGGVFSDLLRLAAYLGAPS